MLWCSINATCFRWEVERADVREYGKSILLVDQPQSKILKGVPETSTVWMSHFDYISKIAPGFEITTHTKDCPVASCENKEKDLYAIQFHPEVLHSEYGKTMLSNFVLDVCNCAGDWRMDSFVEEQIKAIKEKVGNGKYYVLYQVVLTHLLQPFYFLKLLVIN